jgi:hypothetical protein
VDLHHLLLASLPAHLCKNALPHLILTVCFLRDLRGIR